MKTPALLLTFSLVALAAALFTPALAGATVPAFAAALAGAILFVRGLFRSKSRPPRETAQRRILVDGSNVLFWRDNTPRIETLQEVLRTLASHGFTPSVIFDASAGHRIAGRYLDDRHFAPLLGLPEARILVVPKGTSADDYLLKVAQKADVPIITNDRFRDWLDSHPAARTPGRLIRGGFDKGTLWLEGF